MAKKKLLNEKQVRRFMGLAGIRPLNEAGTYMEQEPAADKEELGAGPSMDDMGDAGEMGDEMGGDMPDAMGDEMEPEMDADMGDADGEVELTSQDVEKLRSLVDIASEAGEVVSKLEGAAGDEADEMDDADLDAPEMDDEGPEMDAPDMDDEGDAEADGDEEVIDEALRGVNLELSEDEVVQEVARRVAKRILKAKQAQARLDEALGNKTRRPTRRPRRNSKK